MDRGFLWFAHNSDTVDYTKLSIKLAQSIKQHNQHNQVCVIVDPESQFESEYIDEVRVIDRAVPFANEYRAFALTPFTHTIKLESDMLFTANTDWWWNYLTQHDLVFSVDCLNYKDEVVKDISYRKLFARNCLPNTYNGLTYFRKSELAHRFFQECKHIVQNWTQVRDTVLYNCHDEFPTTDVVYALAYRNLDPTSEQLVDYPWFKFVHNKPDINGEDASAHNEYLYPVKVGNKIYHGGRRLHRLWHYYDKTIPEVLDARVF